MAAGEDFIELFNLEFLEGKPWTRADLKSSAKVGVIAEGLAEKLFDDPKDAIGKTLKVKNMRIKVVGLIAKIGNPERDNALIIPYTTSFLSLNTKKEFFVIYLGVEDKDKVLGAKRQAEKILLKRYEDDEFSVFEPSDILESLDQIFAILNGVLVALGSISLLVGGIGIMNIMYANVTERTKEIGIRRAIGANKLHILVQFLVESMALSLLGGVSGLLIAAAITLAARPFFPLEINLLAVSIAIGVSSLIGMFFGVFPARRAANLTPIEAIRY